MRLDAGGQLPESDLKNIGTCWNSYHKLDSTESIQHAMISQDPFTLVYVLSHVQEAFDQPLPY